MQHEYVYKITPENAKELVVEINELIGKCIEQTGARHNEFYVRAYIDPCNVFISGLEAWLYPDGKFNGLKLYLDDKWIGEAPLWGDGIEVWIDGIEEVDGVMNFDLACIHFDEIEITKEGE